MRGVAAVAALGCCIGLLGPGSARAGNWVFAYKFFGLSCHPATLTYASGVHNAGDVVSYTFWSTCRVAEYGEPSKDEKHNDLNKLREYVLSGGGGIYIRNVTGDFKVEGKANWTRKTGLARELLAVSGTFNGKISTERPGCPKDPFLAKHPGGCKKGTSSVAIDPSTPDDAKLAAAVTKWPSHPIFNRHFDLEEAKAFSIKSADAGSTVPPPPPPEVKVTTKSAKDSAGGGAGAAGSGAPPQMPRGPVRTHDTPTVAAAPQVPAAGSLPGTQPQRTRGAVRAHEAPTIAVAPQATNTRGAPSAQPLQVLIEGEQAASAASVSQGRVAVQGMDRFGAQWSGNKQLFWSGGQVGAALDLTVDVPQAGPYAVLLRLTRAPDYGDLKFEVDGRKSFINFAGYAPQVSLADAPIGTFQLAPGPRKISIMITGRQAQATNFFVGIDRVTLTMLARPK